jgi:hypothetical protein
VILNYASGVRALANVFFASLLGLSCFGCAVGRLVGAELVVKPLHVTAKPPGRVQVVVSVLEGGKAPDELGPENFEVREADVPLGSEQVGLRVQSLGTFPGHEALVLVDGSRAFTDAERGPLGDALAQLVDRLRFHQNVTLLAFDGSSELRSIARYNQSAMVAPLAKDPGIARLLAYKPRDKSTSLYSAIIKGRKALDERLPKTFAVEPVGSLIVVARGPDQAGRADEAEARAALRGRRSFLLKVGTWSKDSSLDWVGGEGTRVAASLGTLGTPVDELARQVDEVFLRDYVVTYCSPARSGKRQLDVVVKLRDETGQERVARATSEIDANGFNASCKRGSPQAPAR